jgi:hypothetical protein
MRKCIEVLLNKIFRKDLCLLFGEDSRVRVNFVKYSTNHHSFIVDCTLYPTDIDKTTEVYPDGIIVLVEDSWKYTGISEKISVTVTLGDN